VTLFYLRPSLGLSLQTSPGKDEKKDKGPHAMVTALKPIPYPKCKTGILEVIGELNIA